MRPSTSSPSLHQFFYPYPLARPGTRPTDRGGGKEGGEEEGRGKEARRRGVPNAPFSTPSILSISLFSSIIAMGPGGGLE